MCSSVYVASHMMGALLLLEPVMVRIACLISLVLLVLRSLFSLLKWGQRLCVNITISLLVMCSTPQPQSAVKPEKITLM